MTNTNEASMTSAGMGQQSNIRRLLIAEWPYALLYVAVVIGVGVTNVDPGSALLFWQILIPVFGALALVIGWERSGSENQERIWFAVRTVAHWAALFVLVRMLYIPQLRDVLNNETMGLLMILLIGYSALQAGIYGNLRMVVVGLFLIFSGIGIAFLDDAAVAITIVLGLGAILALAGSILWQKFHQGSAN